MFFWTTSCGNNMALILDMRANSLDYSISIQIVRIFGWDRMKYGESWVTCQKLENIKNKNNNKKYSKCPSSSVTDLPYTTTISLNDPRNNGAWLYCFDKHINCTHSSLLHPFITPFRACYHISIVSNPGSRLNIGEFDVLSTICSSVLSRIVVSYKCNIYSYGLILTK